MPVAYFVRGGGASWAVIKLYPDNREEIVAGELSKEAAIDRCAELLDKIPRGVRGCGRATACRGHCASGAGALDSLRSSSDPLPRRCAGHFLWAALSLGEVRQQGEMEGVGARLPRLPATGRGRHDPLQGGSWFRLL